MNKKHFSDNIKQDQEKEGRIDNGLLIKLDSTLASQ